MEESQKIYFFSQKGMQVRLPNKFFHQILVCPDWKPPTWAEKRQQKLIDRLKRIKQIKNIIILVCLRAVGVLISVIAGGYVAYAGTILRVHSTPLGILSAMVIIAGGLVTWAWTDDIETNTFWMTVKRKDKTYR